MSTKTYFKRISLAVIFALGFGALSSAPSQALVTGSTAVALSAATDSKIATETSTVTITASFTPTAANESITVTVLGTGGTGAQTTHKLRLDRSDSLNIGSGGTDTPTVVAANSGLTYAATTPNVFTRVKAIFTAGSLSVVGTHVYTVNVAIDGTILATTTYSITVAAANTDATAGQSQIWLNQVLPSGSTYIQSDSALVVSANQTPDLSLMTPAKVAYLAPNFRNSAGESVVATTGTNVDGQMVVKITSGPGLLSKNSADSTKDRQFTISRGDSLTIWNDGASGVTTITSYIGTTPLTQAAKTITFYGKATKFVATANAVTANGWNLVAGSESATAGSGIVTFVATDATDLKVPSASQNRNSKFFLHSSDTKVVRGKQSATLGYGECTAPSSVADQAAGKWTCDMFVIDSGTVTLTVSDSMTIASSLYTSNAISVTVAGAAYKGTLAFAKTNVQTGENVMMTITCVDRAGRACGQPTTSAVGYSGLFNSGGTQTRQFLGGYSTGDGVSTGTATFTTVYQWAAGSVFMGGTETALVTMPLTTGDVVIDLTTGGADALVVPTVTLKVSNAAVDAAAAAAKSAEDAAVAAAQKAAKDAVAAADAATAAAKAAQAAAVAEAAAATDAANEAIDAANAATDAANLAAEAADAATVAAEEARDAADAATAAVEELATQVSTLIAGLKAQLTTVANTVAKIAKKVKA